MSQPHPAAALFFTLLLTFCCTGTAGAGTVTMTAYYPAPTGDYQNLSVSNNVGIGTTVPQYALEVDGEADIETGLSSNGAPALIFGGMYSIGTGTFQDYVNPLTAANSCPAGFTPYNIAGGTYKDASLIDTTFSIIYCGK